MSCSCPNAGWCERHKIDKPPHLHRLCQTREDYCAMWDRRASGVQRQQPPAEPSWVRLVSYFKSPDDSGVGDTVARYAAMLGGEAFKAWSKKLGMPCGCTQRQAEWNARYPYTSPHDQPQS